MFSQVPQEIRVRLQSFTRNSARGSSQDHLLQFWDTLNDVQRAQLLEHVEGVDFETIGTLYSASSVEDRQLDIVQAAGAPTKLISSYIRGESPQEFQQAEKAGWKALREGRVGVVLVAGGEGSRLGFPYPKGQFPIGPVSKKSLYQLLAEQLGAIARRANMTIPYYVMTSDATHLETIEFFEDGAYFGLDPAHVYFFRQGKMPAVDQRTGQVLMAAQDSIAFSPDGHGGLLEAMRKAHLFDDLRHRKIEILFYHQVDNPLVRVCDPAFLGFHLLNRADVSTKVVGKEDPAEKVGLLVEANGRHHMIEYTDLPSELAEQCDSSGKLRLRCGNIAVHVFRCDFLERMSKEKDSLPYHRSSKAVSFVDESGDLIHPKQNNAFKFERFIFDILPRAERPLAMEVIREREFMPLKNREGAFSPDHVRQSMRRLHTSWLKQAGWTTEDELSIEIPASVALDGADFQNRFREPQLNESDRPDSFDRNLRSSNDDRS